MWPQIYPGKIVGCFRMEGTSGGQLVHFPDQSRANSEHETPPWTCSHVGPPCGEKVLSQNLTRISPTCIHCLTSFKRSLNSLFSSLNCSSPSCLLAPYLGGPPLDSPWACWASVLSWGGRAWTQHSSCTFINKGGR